MKKILKFIKDNYTSILLAVVVLSSAVNMFLTHQKNAMLKDELVETKTRYFETRELHLELSKTYIEQRKLIEAQTELIEEVVSKLQESK